MHSWWTGSSLTSSRFTPGWSTSLSAAAHGCLAFIIVLLGSECAYARDNSAVLATVNGETLTTLDLDALLATQPVPDFSRGLPQSLSTDGLLQRLIQNRLLEQEGYRIEADKKREVRNQVWDLKRHKGMMALIDSVSQEARRADQSALVRLLQQTNTMYRVSHILVPDEASALAMVDSLRAGAVFATLADRHSQDTTSVVRAGGDLGWARKDLYIPAFSQALETLTPGEFSGPVRSERGWHVLELTETRTETVGQSTEMEDAVREAAKGRQVMETLDAYVRALFHKYGAEVDTTLLASLDYGSDDPDVGLALQSSDQVLVAFPWRTITVRDLSQELRFRHFHGLTGKAEASRLRDKAFHEWTTELLLRHEGSVLGLDRTPLLLVEAEAMERSLLREAVLSLVLDFPFDPSAEEIEAYYLAHTDDYRSTPRFRVSGVLVGDEANARKVRAMLGNGARMGWLATNAPEVVDRKPKALSGWLEPTYLGLTGEVSVGDVLGPTRLGETWAISEVVEVEPSQLLPLARCREQVLRAMKGERMGEAVRRAVEHLEAEATVEISRDASDLVQARIEAWLGRPIDAQ